MHLYNSTHQFTLNAGSSDSNNLVVGSAIQITTVPNEPPCYGVIRWIGTVPGVQGQVAGIELVSAYRWPNVCQL